MSEAAESNVRHVTVSDADDGQRLDRWIKKHVSDLGYGLAQKLIRTGQIRIDGKRAKTDTRLSAGQEIRLPPAVAQAEAKPKISKAYRPGASDKKELESWVLYDDGDILALNKPAGLAVQGGSKIGKNLDDMLAVLTNRKGLRPSLLHRLDKETSGVILTARQPKTIKALGQMFKTRSIEKEYWALAVRGPELEEGEIIAPLIKAGGRSEKMVIDTENGKKAITRFAVAERASKKAAFVIFWPLTGRTHQIRVHAAESGFPLLSDGKYGGDEAYIDGLTLAKRVHLHAKALKFKHPVTSQMITVHAPLPADLSESWEAFGFNPNFNSSCFADGLCTL